MLRESAGAKADYKLSSLPQNTARRLGGEEVGQSQGSDRHREGGGFKTCWSLSGKVDAEADRLGDGVIYSVDIFFSCARRLTKMNRVEGARRRMNTPALLGQSDSCPPTWK